MNLKDIGIHVLQLYANNLLVSLSGVCGGSASGKTTVAKKIIEALDVQWVSLLSMDSFYRVVVYYSISLWAFGTLSFLFLCSFSQPAFLSLIFVIFGFFCGIRYVCVVQCDVFTLKLTRMLSNIIDI